MHARRDREGWAQRTMSFMPPTDTHQAPLETALTDPGADDYRGESGRATWLAKLVRYTLYSETVGIVLRSERARRPHLVATAGVGSGDSAAWWDQIRREIPDLGTISEPLAQATGLRTVHDDDVFVSDASRRVARLVLPLLVGERRFGVLIVEFSFGTRIMPDALLRARAMAHLVAIALDHERLMEEREEWSSTVGQLRQESENTEAALMQVVHELRGPLTTMKLGAQIAERQLKRADEKRLAGDTASLQFARATTALTLANRNANVAERVLTDLADITRIRTGSIEVRPMRCDLAATVREAVAGQRMAWRRRIIHLEAPSEAVPVLADEDRVAQVLGNYLTNALKYSPDDHPVEVRLSIAGAEAYVGVSDHGIGIAQENQRRVWERFYRANGYASYSADGLGVGLFICRQLIERMGGMVGVESVLGEGSTFWFTVPLAAV